MNAKQMVELLQQHHPHIGETEAIILINDALADFSERTKLYSTLQPADTTSTSGQLLYDVNLGPEDNILTVKNVYVDNRLASRLIGKLQLKDLT